MKKILSFLVVVVLVLAFSLSTVSAEVKDFNPTPDEGNYTKMQREREVASLQRIRRNGQAWKQCIM